MSSTSNQCIERVTDKIILEIASKVVLRYISRSVIPLREKEDVVMAIVEKFLYQREKIDQSFEGKSKILTYYIAVLNRMCCEVIRKDSKHWYAINENENTNNLETEITAATESEKVFIFNNEVFRLSSAMLFFNGERAKVNLFLKYYFNIPVIKEDVKKYSENSVEKILYILSRTDSTNKSEVFENLAMIVNIVENKNIKGDAVRMWLNKQIDIMLNRLNHNGIANHTKESLAILMEMKHSKLNSAKGDTLPCIVVIMIISYFL